MRTRRTFKPEFKARVVLSKLLTHHFSQKLFPQTFPLACPQYPMGYGRG